MARRRKGQRLLVVLARRLRDIGFHGVLREVLQLPYALSSPLVKLAAVLRVPRVLLWAALVALLGSAVLAVSWILTALITALTRPHSNIEPGHGVAGAYGDAAAGDGDGDETAALHAQSTIKGRAAAAGGGGGQPSPVSSWLLGGDDRTDDEAEGHGGDSACDAGWDPADGNWPVTWPAAAAAIKTHGTRSAWLRPLSTGVASAMAPLPPLYLDEQQAAEVQRLIGRAAAVIPATAFEAARSIDAVFGLRLDASGYRVLLLPADSGGAGAALGFAARGKRQWKGQVPTEANMEEEPEEELPQEGTAALGRLALHAHLARYLYGIHGGVARSTAATDTATSAPLAADGAASSSAPTAPAPPAAAAAAPEAATAAVLYDLAVFVRLKVLAALARRFRMDLLMSGPSGQPGSEAGLAPITAPTGGRSAIKDSNPRAHVLCRAAAAAAAVDASAGAQSPPPSTAALATALLRLVWEAHMADPGRAWVAICVLAGLARELKLVVSGQQSRERAF